MIADIIANIHLGPIQAGNNAYLKKLLIDEKMKIIYSHLARQKLHISSTRGRRCLSSILDVKARTNKRGGKTLVIYAAHSAIDLTLDQENKLRLKIRKLLR